MGDMQGHLCSHHEADESQHSESPVFDLLQLQLWKVALCAGVYWVRHTWM